MTEVSKDLAALAKFLGHEAQSQDHCCHGTGAAESLEEAAESLSKIVSKLDNAILDAELAATR